MITSGVILLNYYLPICGYLLGIRLAEAKFSSSIAKYAGYNGLFGF
jgi:hypothetical protein